MKIRILIVAALALSLSGCATTVSQQEVAAAHFEPLPKNYQKLITDFMAGRLRDPYTAIYRFGPPAKGYWKDGWAYGGAKHFGWVVPVLINARNAFGGYVGAEMNYFGYEHGQIFGLTQLWTQEPKMAGFIGE